MKIEKRFLVEITLSLILVVLLLLLLNPTHVLMPVTTQRMLLLILVVVFLSFFSFVWREKVADERESLHRNLAGRFSYLVGSSVLVIGIIVQSFHHEIDVWLVTALIATALSKIIGTVYSQFKH